MNGCQTRVLRFDPETHFRSRHYSGVSLHSHTMHSREYLGRLPGYIGKFPIGGYIIERYLAIGLTAVQETHYHFGLAPEIGVFFQNPVGAVFLNARYNMAFASGGVPFQQFLSISLGYAWER